ncbi:lamin L3 isoform X2 [Sphaeramia orbicularis]|uniref:lamin L3 isoform X2 n=1 Tax=Sphaeramia orbicularis TaxID=375764 RepID=UPI0011802DFD|nr:lamin-L(III)-like isoform X2 [Sphaeramia orbicularis]
MAAATSTPVASGSRVGRPSAGRTPASGSGSSPTRRSRIQEKDELRHLNDRLANYIQRVQELEGERSTLLIRLEETEESKSRETGTMRRLYEEELADVRATLDGVAGERARLQIDYGSLSEEYKKLQSRFQKIEGDLLNTSTQKKKLEAALNSKEAERSKLLLENGTLNGDITDLQDHLRKVEDSLAETKNHLSTETLRRVDLENQVQTLREQLAFQKNMSEQETQEIRHRSETQLMEMESTRRREFEGKLAEVMQQLRQDHEAQMQLYKEEVDKTFSAKLQIAQQAALDNNNAALATKDELESTKLRVETLSSQLQQSQKDKMVLEDRFQELERTLDLERKVWQQKLNQKEQEMLNMRSQMYSQMEDYENLLDVKLALDMEISAYRKMLEVEEQRLQLSPSPSQRTTVPRTQEEGRIRLRGRKRKHEDASGSTPAYKRPGRSLDVGAVSVMEVDADGRYVQLKNNSDTDQPIGGWVVRRVYSDAGDISFHIPSPCVLAGGQTLTIWAAGAEEEADTGDLILEGHRSWGPATDVRVILLKPEYEETAERRVRLGRNEETQLEFDEEFVGGSDIQHFRRQDLSKEASCAVM